MSNKKKNGKFTKLWKLIHSLTTNRSKKKYKGNWEIV